MSKFDILFISYFTELVPTAQPQDYKTLAACLEIFLWATAFMAPLEMSTVVLGFDPLSEVDTNYQAVKLGLFLLRLVVLYQAFNEKIKAINSFFIVGLMLICLKSDFMRRLGQKKTKNRSGSGSCRGLPGATNLYNFFTKNYVKQSA